jgi:FAD/FMN-containing dehydrogenase
VNPTTTIPESAMHELETRIRGTLLRPDDTGYDDARRVWNGMVDRKPGVIVRCRGVADVKAAVDIVREHRLVFAVRAGGHSVAGKSVCEGGVMIDLSLMTGVTVDPVSRTARAGAGATWGDFDHEAQAFGLGTTGGLISSTGVAGLTLGGGIGYLTRTHGLACDNLQSLDVVTAAGEFVRASETENADLFWACRGGGGNFGVVTSLEFRLHEVGPEVAVAQVFHPIEAAGEVLRFYREYTAAAPDETACYALIVNVPPVEPFPEASQGKPAIALVACDAGPVAEGKARLAPLAAFGNPILAFVDAMPYTALQSSFDAGNPKGQRYYWKSMHLAVLSDDALDTVARHCADFHGDFTIVGIEPLGGAFGRIAPDATAFPHRDVPYSFGVWTGWADPANDAANIAWTRAFHDAMTPYGAGAYVNYLGEDEGGRVEEAYGVNWARLQEVKRRWDPDNLFRMNQNIAPGA